MPDTGAPWNIPYVAGTDLVSDWPTDSLALANAIANGLDDALLPGIGSNVVSTTKTDTFSTTSTSYVAVTGLSVTITPTSDTSKILVVAFYQLSQSSVGNGAFSSLTRGGTDLLVGDAAGSRVRSTGGDIANAPSGNHVITAVFLDAPSTSSAVTYDVRVRRGLTSGTVYVNRTGEDLDDARFGRFPSTITAIEVAA